MQIDGRKIGSGQKLYFVAELSANHNGSLDRAIAIIRAAAESGASAIKVQLYSPEKLAAARGGPHKVLTDGPWSGRTLIDIYTQGHTPIGWVPDLQDAAANLGITLFASVFHVQDVGVLDALGMPAFKISSFDAGNLPLIREAASTGKPLIISTGMASLLDVATVLQTAKPTNPHLARGSVAQSIDLRPGAVNHAAGAVWSDVALLHCVSDYPCPIEKANLGRIDELRYRFQVPIGFSDHTLGTTAAIAAVARGACIIEKHLTLDRADGGLDASFSSEPYEFREMVEACNDAWAACQDSEPDNAYKDLRVSA